MAQAPAKESTRWALITSDRAILAVVMILTIVPTLVDVVASGVAGAIRYSAQDAFYYHTVARNVVTHHGVTFDQTHATNGFHPLWQVVLVVLYLTSSICGASDGTYLILSILLSIAMVSGAVYVAARAFMVHSAHLSAWFLLWPIGIYGYLIAPLWFYASRSGYVVNSIEGPPQFYGSLPSFMNGMESPVALLAFAVAARLLVAKDRSPTKEGLVLASLVLARLDTAFIAVSLCAWASLGELRRGMRRNALRCALWFVAPIASYLVLNRLYAGAWLPVSGSTKTSFPTLGPGNVYDIAASVDRFLADVHSFFRFWRLGQMLIPAGFAFVAIPLLLLRVRQRQGGWVVTLDESDRLERFLACAGVGVVGLATYNFWFVYDLFQGHWYYAVSIFWMSLTAIALLQRIPMSSTLARLGAIVASTVLSVAIFLKLGRQLECHALQATFFESTAADVRVQYPKDTRMLEYDDGIIAFATRLPSMNAMGLAIDREAARAARRGRLGELAYDRGYDRVAVLSYNELVLSEASPEQLRGFLDQMHSKLGLAPEMQLTLDYTVPGTRFGVFRISRP